jgi:glucosamine-6-phosphate deaminase
MQSLMHGRLTVRVHDSTKEMAEDAARQVAECIRALLSTKAEVNVVFSGALSQQMFHHALAREPGVEWRRVNAYAVDDFWSPRMDPECAVAQQPRRDLYETVRPKSVHTIRFDAPDPEVERSRYEALIAANPPDIACLGIGRSGHVAFNEPGQTDFGDSLKVRIINVVDESKQQLMDDPNFKRLGIIPDKGITITMAELMRCPHVFVIVPFREKAPVVQRLFALQGATAEFPASILREKDGAILFVDADAYSQVRDRTQAEDTHDCAPRS